VAKAHAIYGRSARGSPAVQPIECAFSRVLEVRLLLAALGIPEGGGVRFQFSLWQGGLPMDAVRAGIYSHGDDGSETVSGVGGLSGAKAAKRINGFEEGMGSLLVYHGTPRASLCQSLPRFNCYHFSYSRICADARVIVPISIDG
jgi:hypothetical protein